MTAITIEQLHKSYPRTWLNGPVQALKGISLAVEPGEVFGFIGPNGAGKSTTIKILTGAMAPTSGLVKIFGAETANPESRLGVGYVPENPSLPDYLTPLEILSMALVLHRTQANDLVALSMMWLERFSLSQVARKPIRSFSKGMAQRTALAHAMCISPRLLILDEPLSGLDPIGRREVVDILMDYKREGGTVFLTSHVLYDVERLADRFGLIHQGELKTTRSPGELVGGYQQVAVRSIGIQEVVGMRLETSDRWYGEVPRDELWPLLARLEAAGHSLVEIKPALSLESAFMQYVKAVS